MKETLIFEDQSNEQSNLSIRSRLAKNEKLNEEQKKEVKVNMLIVYTQLNNYLANCIYMPYLYTYMVKVHIILVAPFE